jgi:hypothetical protein
MSDSYEKFAAIREGYRNAAEDAWFKAIPNLEPRQAFCRGFDAGYSHSQAAATHAGAAAERVTPAMVEQLAGATAEAEAIDGNLKAIRSRLDALTSAPAEPDAYNRRLRAQLEQEWADLQRLKNAYTPTGTPPAAGAIGARGHVKFEVTLPYLQERLQDHTCERIENVSGAPGLTLYITKPGAHPECQLFVTEAYALWFNLGKALAPILASRQEAPAAAGAAQAVADARLQWLHSPASMNVDGWEWGIFKVKWGKREGEHQIRHTFADFSDLDEAMAVSGAALAATPAPEADMLSDDQIDALQAEYDCFGHCDAPRIHDFARGVEKAVRKQSQMAACNFCLEQAVEARAALKAAQPIEREDGK